MSQKRKLDTRPPVRRSNTTIDIVSDSKDEKESKLLSLKQGRVDHSDVLKKVKIMLSKTANGLSERDKRHERRERRRDPDYDPEEPEFKQQNDDDPSDPDDSDGSDESDDESDDESNDNGEPEDGEVEGETDDEDDHDPQLMLIKNIIQEQRYDPLVGLDIDNDIYYDLMQQYQGYLAQIKDKIKSYLSKDLHIFIIDEAEYYGQQNINENLGNMVLVPFEYPDRDEIMDPIILQRLAEKTNYFEEATKGFRDFDEKHAARVYFGCNQADMETYRHFNLSVRMQFTHPQPYLPLGQGKNMIYFPRNINVNQKLHYAKQIADFFYGRSNKIQVNQVTNVTISLLAQMRFRWIKQVIKFAWSHGGLRREEDKTILLKVLGYPDFRNENASEAESEEQAENEPYDPYNVPEDFDWRQHIEAKLGEVPMPF